MYLKGQSEVVVYHPPKSVGHAHHSRLRGARRSWLAIEQFLHNCTSYHLNEHSIKLTCHGPDKYTDASVAERCAVDAEALAGFPPATSGIFRTWALSKEQLSAALEFAFTWSKYPKQPVEPLSLYVSFGFEWLGTKSQTSSSIGVSIWGRSVILQPTFVFDLSAESSELKELVTSIENSLPFKLRDDYFKSIVPTASGKGEKAIKLRKGWRNAL
jgi:hypothetical protein